MPQLMDSPHEALSLTLHHDIVSYVTPVLACANGRDFVFESFRHPSEGEVRDVLAALSYPDPVGNVRFARKSRFILNPSCSRRTAYHLTFRGVMERWFGASLRASLGEHRFAKMRAHFGVGRGPAVVSVIEDPPMGLLMDGVRSALFMFFAASVAEDMATITRLKPLVAMLPRVVPVGIRQGSIGDWNAVIA